MTDAGIPVKRVLLTGASGFVGRHLAEQLRSANLEAIAAIRDISKAPHSLAAIPFELERPEQLTAATLQGIDCVYHLAARVHVMDRSKLDEEQFHLLNSHATRVLAQTAAAAGVRRFVYLSSVKVNGEQTFQQPFFAQDPPAPADAYGRSKLAAERALAQVAAATGLETVVIRPPLVYGPGVAANFRRLMAAVAAGWPLPFGAVANRRSMVNVWNLVSLLLHVGRIPGAAGTWLVSDNDDLSTPRLVELIGRALGRAPPRLLRIPVPVLNGIGSVTGKRAEMARLVDSLQVDISPTRNLLGWEPPVNVEDGIARTVAWFKATANGLTAAVLTHARQATMIRNLERQRAVA